MGVDPIPNVPKFYCTSIQPRNRSWTRSSGLRWGALARRDDDAGSLPDRRSNAASVRQGGSIGCVALSPVC